MAQKTYTITPLSCVHIGTGEELTPLDYKIASKIGNKGFDKPTYWKFSNDRILKRLLDENNEKAMVAFERASVEGNMKELQQFFQDNCTNLKNDTDYPCEITKGFLELYKANRNKSPNQNAAKVLQMYHTQGTPRPAIPGSSLKGSIRTALLNKYLANLSDGDYEYLHKNSEQERNLNKRENMLQQKLLEYSDAKNDPLRAVSVQDCSFKATGTQLVGGLKLVSFNKQTESLNSLGTQIQAEVINGSLLKGNAAADLFISINNKLQKANLSQYKDDKPRYLKAITFDDIRNACNYFYLREFKYEYDEFYKDVNDGTETLIVELKNKLEKAVETKGQFIIRVGRWSQVEFVTFEDKFRKPETKKDKFGKPLGYGGTRTLFDYDGKYVPMGWCILSEKQEGKQ